MKMNPIQNDSSVKEQLTSLARGVRRSQGAFSLFFIESNLAKQQIQVQQALEDDFQFTVLLLNCVEIADRIFTHIHLDEWIAEQISQHNTTQRQQIGKPAQLVMLVGLEQLFPISTYDDIPNIIIEMNWRRNYYRELNIPMLLFLPSFAIELLASYASDFYDWYSGVYPLSHSEGEHKLACQQQIQSMQHPDSGISSHLYANTQLKREQINHLKTLLKQTKNPVDRSYILSQLGLLFHSQGRYASALDHFQQSLFIRQEIGDKAGEGATLNSLSQIYQAQGDYATALKYLKQSLAICQEIGNKAGEGSTLNNLSQIYQAQGDYATALDYLKQSLAICQEIVDKAGEGATLNNLATLSHVQGDYTTALDYLEQSLAINQEIGDKAGEGATLNNLSQIYQAQGDYTTALDYLEQSLAINQEIGGKAGEGSTLNNLSQIYQAQGDYRTALDYLEQSLAINQEIGDKAGEGATLNNLSQIYQEQGDYATALDYLEQSLAINQEIGGKAGEGATLNNLSQIYKAQGDYATALKYLKQSLAICQEIGDKAGICQSYFNLGICLLQMPRHPEYQKFTEYFIESYKLAKELDLADILVEFEHILKA